MWVSLGLVSALVIWVATIIIGGGVAAHYNGDREAGRWLLIAGECVAATAVLIAFFAGRSSL